MPFGVWLPWWVVILLPLAAEGRELGVWAPGAQLSSQLAVRGWEPALLSRQGCVIAGLYTKAVFSVLKLLINTDLI